MSPFRRTGKGIRVFVKVTPRAARNGLQVAGTRGDGGVYLKVKVTAVPEKGKANAAVVALLAREWKLPKSRLTVETGATDRSKTILVSGPENEVLPQLERWLRNSGPENDT